MRGVLRELWWGGLPMSMTPCADAPHPQSVQYVQESGLLHRGNEAERSCVIAVTVPLAPLLAPPPRSRCRQPPTHVYTLALADMRTQTAATFDRREKDDMRPNLRWEVSRGDIGSSRAPLPGGDAVRSVLFSEPEEKESERSRLTTFMVTSLESRRIW